MFLKYYEKCCESRWSTYVEYGKVTFFNYVRGLIHNRQSDSLIHRSYYIAMKELHNNCVLCQQSFVLIHTWKLNLKILA